MVDRQVHEQGELPEHMTATVLTGHGGPEQLVVRDDIGTPVPRDGEVVVRVERVVSTTPISTLERAGTEPIEDHLTVLAGTGFPSRFRGSTARTLSALLLRRNQQRMSG